ncbi:MAG TPA: hypothetical protein VJ487_03325 [Alphaproteobacteria bacterium]|nr:hypothetical protein [Alphaproteobacteria bacterium]
MERQQQIERIREARALIAAAMAECRSPQIETILRSADAELHWALWNLGEPVPLRPELEYGEAVPRGRTRVR